LGRLGGIAALARGGAHSLIKQTFALCVSMSHAQVSDAVKRCKICCALLAYRKLAFVATLRTTIANPITPRVDKSMHL
jgi:hypothetical protein